MRQSYFIRHIEIKPALVLAPMSGVTTSAFRRLIKELNPGNVGLVMTEFVSVEALTRKVNRSLEMIRFRDTERPIAIQIFGHDINRMRDAAMMVQDHGADIVDINCGCPAPKVVRKGGGCELMRQPEHLAKIVKEVRRSVSIPLTMKIRSGWDDASKNALEIARMAESEGIEALAVHGRTRAQLYRGEADWNVVEEVAKSIKIPVLGSGDVVSHKTAEDRFRPAISGLYIGRGALKNPLIFAEINTGIPQNARADEGRVLSIVERYIELLREDLSERNSLGKVKQLVSQFCSGFLWRKPVLTAMKLDDQLSILRSAREKPILQYSTGFGINSCA